MRKRKSISISEDHEDRLSDIRKWEPDFNLSSQMEQLIQEYHRSLSVRRKVINQVIPQVVSLLERDADPQTLVGKLRTIAGNYKLNYEVMMKAVRDFRPDLFAGVR